MTETVRELLTEIYRAFNAREIETILAVLDPDVDWPNGMEGGRIQGRSGVREYWERQWSTVDSRVELVGFETDLDGRTIVNVQIIVRDLSGALLIDRMVKHVYLMQNGLIKSMEIREE
jgi:hypothetical protein